MKTNAKKIVALFLCAVILVAGTALTTVAYLTSQDEVTNTFTVGKVNITLDEADVDEYGELLYKEAEEGKDPELADRVKANTYKLVPGVTYVKDPTVTVLAGSEKSYIRMIVTVTNIDKVKSIFGTETVGGKEYFLPQNFVNGWDSTTWVTTNEIVEANNTATYEFRYSEVVSTVDATEKLTLDALFDSFTVPGFITEEELEVLNDDEFEIEIVAHAIQEAGFESEEAAWEAFDNQNPAEAE